MELCHSLSLKPGEACIAYTNSRPSDMGVSDRHVFLGLFTISLHSILKLWFINNYDLDLGYFTNKMCKSTFLEKLEVVATLVDYSLCFVVTTLDNKIFSTPPQSSSLLNNQVTVGSGLLSGIRR